MANGIKIAATIGLVGFLAACGQQRDEVVTTTAPQPVVQPEPTYSKY